MNIKEFISNLHPFLVISAGVANIGMAFWTAVAAPKNAGKFPFVHTALSVGGYLTFFGLMSLPFEMNTAFTIGRVGEMWVHQISPAFYSFSVFLLDLKSQKALAKLAIPIGIATSFMVLNIPGHHMAHFWWGNFIHAASAAGKWPLLIYFLVSYGFTIAAFINLIKGYRRTSDIVLKRQLHYVILAFGIAYLGSLDYLTWVGIHYYPFGFIPLTIFTFIISYTTLRHRLMAVNVFFGRIFLLILIYSILITLMVPLINLFSTLLIQWRFTIPGTVLILAIFIGGAFSVGPFLYAYFVRHAYWLKGHTSTGLTHELKSPLATIQSATQMLLDQQNQLSPDKSTTIEYLNMVQRNTERLEVFVQDLLAVAKIQNDNVELQKTHVDLAQIISEVVGNYSHLADKKGVPIKFLQENISLVEVDREKIQQVISNLISNALKFSDKSSIDISLQQKSKCIECTIKDNGRGIPSKDLERVFDRFYHGKHSSKGSGLGLTIAKAWVEAHGGKIWAESEGEGKGTKVTFTLPTHA